MEPGNKVLGDAAMQAADSGNLIEAVKIVREQTGLGLAEAKSAVEAYLARTPAREAPAFQTQASTLPMEALVALDSGSLIEAIKATRVQTGMGLKESKDAVEAYLERNPDARMRFQAATQGNHNTMARVVIVSLLTAAVVLIYLTLSGRW